ncbi:Uncharacterised protein [Mycobacteroides abscessus subsp. abscessus]|nr:Uncharacterised protein [Mycobacteroides abscessus subsp. abscessus]
MAPRVTPSSMVSVNSGVHSSPSWVTTNRFMPPNSSTQWCSVASTNPTWLQPWASASCWATMDAA